MTSNGNRTEWNPIQSVIIRVINPFSPKSDQHGFSLYNINALENRVVMRLEYMIREDVSN